MSTLVGPQAVPTSVPGAVGTIVAQTAAAAATQTAELIPATFTPTMTPSPTKTPTVTPSPTPTFLFILATLSKTPVVSTAGPSGKDFSCALTGQTPADGATMSKNESFSANWTVQNNGSTNWDSRNIDFVYASGTKFTSLKAVDLPKSVAAGESITLKITMQAPSQPDTYKTVWTLESGKNTFCRLDLTIVVK